MEGDRHIFSWARPILKWGISRSAKDHYEKGCGLLEHTRLMPSFVGLAKVGVARSKVMNNEKDVDLESLYAHSRNNKIKTAEGWISKYIGEILLNIDDQHISEAEHWIQEGYRGRSKEWYDVPLGKGLCPLC